MPTPVVVGAARATRCANWKRCATVACPGAARFGNPRRRPRPSGSTRVERTEWDCPTNALTVRSAGAGESAPPA
jgi:hypothetical protein